MQIDSLMPPVFIIGLPGRFRGERTEQQLADLGLQVSRSDGVLVSDLPTDGEPFVDQESARVLLKRDLTDGEIGCALAHRAVAKRLLESTHDFCVVLEDDAKLVDPDAFLAAVRASAEVFAGDGESSRVRILYAQRSGLVFGADTGDGGDLAIRPCLTAPHATTGYLINRSAARELVAATSPVTYVADWPPGLFTSATFDAVVPWCVRPDESYESTIAAVREPAAGRSGDRGLTKAWRHGRAVTGVTYLRHRRAFPSFATYFHHEVGRHVLRVLAAKGDVAVDTGDGTVPALDRHPKRSARRVVRSHQ